MRSNGLNHIYRVVWNAARGIWQAVAESGKGHAKSKRNKVARQALAAGSFVLVALPALAVDVLPTGGTVVAGALVNPVTVSNGKMTIEQASSKLAMDWQSFSIGRGNTVEFVQPSASAIALNRVLGSDVSVIQGALKANGQVFLINPNGVLFTPSAQVDVGSLVASTQSIKTADFLSGNYVFEGLSSNAIINQGNVTAANGGAIVLIAAKIVNDGTLTAQRGNVLLGAGSKVTLDLGGPVKLQVENSALETLISNGGAIRADGGHVLLTSQAARTLASSVINNTGLIEAQTLATGEKGEIVLFAHDGKTEIAGTINAQGGFVETSGKTLGIANGTVIKAKQWLLDPVDLIIDGGSGAIGGDTVGASVIESALNGGTNVDLTADNSIRVDHALTWQQNTLNLSAARIDLNQAMTLNGSAGLLMMFTQALNVNKEVLLAGDDAGMMLANFGGKVNFAMKADKTGFDGKFTFSGARSYMGEVDFVGGAPVFSAYTRDATQWGQATPFDAATVWSPILNTRADLEKINGTDLSLSGRYVLGQDINLSGSNWTPIGSWSSPFSGQIDGLGHSVSNMTIVATDSDPSGLVGSMIGGRLTNLAVTGASITGNSSQTAGLLVGYAETDVGKALEISNIITQGGIEDVSGAGGVAGRIRNAPLSDDPSNTVTLSNVHADVVLRNTGDSSGGLVGEMSLNGIYAGPTLVENSSAKVLINNGHSMNVGGLVGDVDSADNSFILRDSYATGHIEGQRQVGGLIGYLAGSDTVIQRCFADIEFGLSSSAHPYSIGGLVGYLESGRIEDSYARGTIYHNSTDEDDQPGGQYIGGLVGYLAEGRINRSYSDVKINLSALDFTEEESGYWGVGGLVGAGYNVSITNSAALGDISIHHGAITGDYAYTIAGGVIGVLDGGGQISNNIYAGKLTLVTGQVGDGSGVFSGGTVGGSWLGGNGNILAGWNDSGETVSGNKFDGTLNPGLSGQAGIEKTASAIAKTAKTTYDSAGLGFDFGDAGPWVHDATKNDGLPYLKWAAALFESGGSSGGDPVSPVVSTPPALNAAVTSAQTTGQAGGQPNSSPFGGPAGNAGPGIAGIPTVVQTNQGSLPVMDMAGGLAFVQAPSGMTGLPREAGGMDPMGFMRVFVVGGGLSLPDGLGDNGNAQNLRRN